MRALARGNGQTAATVNVVTEDNTDDSLLLKAVQHLLQRGQPNWAIDTGTTNSIVVSCTPAMAEYKAGTSIRVLMLNKPTGPTVINCNGLGTKNVYNNSAPLLGNEWQALQVVSMTYDGTQWQCSGLSARPVLAQNTTIYVNNGTGSDTIYDGTAAVVSGSHGPFKTIQRAVNAAYGYSPSQYTITVQVAAGSWIESVITPAYAGPNIVIIGAGATATLITGAGTHVFEVVGPNTLTIQNLSVTATGSGSSCFVAANGATLTTNNTASGAAPLSVFHSFAGATVNVGSHTFNAGTYAAFFYATGLGVMVLQQGALFTVGGPATVGAVAQATDIGYLRAQALPSPTWNNGGNVTGQRYAVTGNSVINSSGNGVNFFPGTVAGAAANGGLYL
ncbi:hypothetical protein XI09_40990 [Bradyrhizobium sp. CCBAU 11386]|nr:hypothetical protein [Bradyrhizobium sp. CCBAU 11386]